VEEEEAKRPLSPVEPGTGAVAAELPIQVKTDGEGETVKAANDSVEFKEESTVAAEEGSLQPQNGRVSTQTPTAETAPRKAGRGRKKADAGSARLYEGLFEANFKVDQDMFEITDLREGIEGGDKTWLEEVKCLVCGTRIC
jgi:hypothetical protein